MGLSLYLLNLLCLQQTTGTVRNALDQRQVDQRQVDQRQVDQRQVDQRQVDQRQVDQRQVDQRQVDQRQVDQRQVDQSQPDQRQVDQRQVDQRQVDQRQVDQRQVDQSQVDQRQVDQSQVDQRQVDQRQGDQRQVDQRQVDQRQCVLCIVLCALWCYDAQYSCGDSCRDPSHWASQFPSCGGLRQSPINIVSSKAHSNSALGPFHFTGHSERVNITLENTGQSATFSLPLSVRLSGGALPGHYRADSFHFHWGRDGSPGSEHTIDGERLPMEMHIVHIKEPYSSLGEAQHDMAGIALLSFLFEESAEDHPHLDTVIEALGRVQKNGSSTNVTHFRLSDIVPAASELHSYYRYVGSMTTPSCEQAVAWTVFKKTLPISSRQLSDIVSKCLFWTGKPMMDNFRPTQPLDGRVVYKSHSVLPLPSPTLVCSFYILLHI